MVQQVTVARPDFRIGQVFVNLQRLRLYPFPVLPVEAFLCDLTDVDFRVEIGGECLVVVAGVAVDDIQVLYLLEVVLGSVGREDARHARVEAATEDGCQSGFLETLAIGPLP